MLQKRNQTEQYRIHNLESQNKNEVQLRPLKKKIDDKINKILMMLGQTPLGNADETEQQVILIAPINKIKQVVSIEESCDNQSQASTTLDPTPCKISEMTSSHRLQNQQKNNANFTVGIPKFDDFDDTLDSSNPNITFKATVLRPDECSQIPLIENILDVQQIQSDENSSSQFPSVDLQRDDSTNEFLSVKVSEDGSNPEMWIYNVQQDSCLPMKKSQNFKPTQIQQNWETKSDGHKALKHHTERILQVPAQLEQDSEQDCKQTYNIRHKNKIGKQQKYQDQKLQNINMRQNEAKLNQNWDNEQIRKKSNTMGSLSTKSGNNQNCSSIQTPMNSPRNSHKDKVYKYKVQNSSLTITKPKAQQGRAMKMNAQKVTNIKFMKQLKSLNGNQRKQIQNSREGDQLVDWARQLRLNPSIRF